MPYRRCGRWGLKLPFISLGLWQGFGPPTSDEVLFATLDLAVEAGVTHFDLANNYGPPPGAAEELFGRYLAARPRELRDQTIVSTKAGWRMWDGPYGDGSSRKYLLASLDQSLKRLGLDYVDIFYSHRHDPETPIAETMDALATAVQSGKALYAGISSYSAAATRDAVRIAGEMGLPITISQPPYSILKRGLEREDPQAGTSLLEVLGETGMGAIVFSPLAQGMLTDKYLDGVPANSRAARSESLKASRITDDLRSRLRALNELAAERGQTLAEMAITWAGRDDRITSVLVGASSAEQVRVNLRAAQALPLTAPELARIDELAPMDATF